MAADVKRMKQMVCRLVTKAGSTGATLLSASSAAIRFIRSPIRCHRFIRSYLLPNHHPARGRTLIVAIDSQGIVFGAIGSGNQ